MSGTSASILFHLVFSTKNREPLIDDKLQPRLYEYLGGAVRCEGGVLLEIGGLNDHLHLLVGWHTKTALSVLLRNLKSHSSGWIHDTFQNRSDFHWQDGYGVFSVSASQCDRVRQYIRSQVSHHKTRSFKEEFERLLVAHGVEFDRERVWD